MINLSSILAMVLMVLVVKHALLQWPQLFPHVVRIMALSTGFAGLTAIFQSFVSNVLFQPQWFDLSFINVLWGEGWWRFSPMGGLVRAQGIYGEPSLLSTYMGMAAGPAMVRLGFFGSKHRGELLTIVPAWAATSVLVSLVLSFSAVVYAGLFFVYMGALASRMTFGVRAILLLLVGSAVAGAILTLAALQAGDTIRERFVDLAVLGQIGNADGTRAVDQDTNLSVQILFLNAYVTFQNFLANPWLGIGVGGHPFAYDALVPALPMASSGALQLNAMDAGALSFRLLSETGVLGLAVFTVAVLSAWFRVRKVALGRDLDASPRLKSLAVGLGGSLAGVFAAKMFRVPSYYGAEFWALFALCLAVPVMASSPFYASRERQT